MDRLLYIGLVAFGGAAGSVLRYLTAALTVTLLGPQRPYMGTFAVNIVGGVLMGFLAGTLAHKGGIDQERWRVLLGVGVLGGFTTFSAFSLDAALLIERRSYGEAGLYVLASVVVAISALFGGLMLARRLFA